jgi:hypothetical protein
MVDDGPDRPTDKNIRHAFLWAVHPANADADPPRHLESALRWLSRLPLPHPHHGGGEPSRATRFVAVGWWRSSPSCTTPVSGRPRPSRSARSTANYPTRDGDASSSPRPCRSPPRSRPTAAIGTTLEDSSSASSLDAYGVRIGSLIPSVNGDWATDTQIPPNLTQRDSVPT